MLVVGHDIATLPPQSLARGIPCVAFKDALSIPVRPHLSSILTDVSSAGAVSHAITQGTAVLAPRDERRFQALCHARARPSGRHARIQRAVRSPTQAAPRTATYSGANGNTLRISSHPRLPATAQNMPRV